MRSAASVIMYRCASIGPDVHDDSLLPNYRTARRYGQGEAVGHLERRRGSKLREPVPDEFFNDASIRDAPAAFVRDAVQNILDATWDRTRPAHVRSFVPGTHYGLQP
jgi:hypothetical protein